MCHQIQRCLVRWYARAKESNGNADWPRFTPRSSQLTSTARGKKRVCLISDMFLPVAKPCIWMNYSQWMLQLNQGKPLKAEYLAPVTCYRRSVLGHCHVFLRHLTRLNHTCHGQVWLRKGVGLGLPCCFGKKIQSGQWLNGIWTGNHFETITDWLLSPS